MLQAIMVKMCLLPDVNVSHSVMRSIALYQMAYMVFPSSAKGNTEFWLSPCGKMCNLQYIS